MPKTPPPPDERPAARDESPRREYRVPELRALGSLADVTRTTFPTTPTGLDGGTSDPNLYTS